jgi:hypothetical protein
MKPHRGCPVQATINALSGKWKVQAVWRLSFGPLRFAELRNLLQGVSEKVLTAQLRELERDGVVSSDGRSLVSTKSHLFAWLFRREIDSDARRALRLGIQTVWDKTEFATKSPRSKESF